MLGVEPSSSAEVCAEAFRRHLEASQQNNQPIEICQIICYDTCMQEVFKQTDDRIAALRREVMNNYDARLPPRHVKGQDVQEILRLTNLFFEQVVGCVEHGIDLKRMHVFVSQFGFAPGPPPHQSGVWKRMDGRHDRVGDDADSDDESAVGIMQGSGDMQGLLVMEQVQFRDYGGPGHSDQQPVDEPRVERWPEENEPQWQCEVGKGKKLRWEAYKYPWQKELKDAWRRMESQSGPSTVVLTWNDETKSIVDFARFKQKNPETCTERRIRFHHPSQSSGGLWGSACAVFKRP